MNRSLSCIGSLVVLSAFTTPIVAQTSDTKPASVGICVYDSRNYSEGAYICAQKALMLTCVLDGSKTTWKIVQDKDISNRCLEPIQRNFSEKRVWSPRRYAARPVAAPAANPAAKCFHFNGKRYCE